MKKNRIEAISKTGEKKVLKASTKNYKYGLFVNHTEYDYKFPNGTIYHAPAGSSFIAFASDYAKIQKQAKPNFFHWFPFAIQNHEDIFLEYEIVETIVTLL